MPTHSTPSGVVVEYFESLRWLVLAANEASDPNHARRLAAMSTILAVTAVEVFFNLWFRIHATESGRTELQDALLADFERKITLDQKLADWPKRHLNSNINLKTGPGQAFVSLKARRNSIVHFESTHETIHTPGLIIHGLANTTEYDALSAVSATDALTTAEALVADVFRLAGVQAEKMDIALTGWIGKSVANSSVDATSAGLPPWLAPHVKR